MKISIGSDHGGVDLKNALKVSIEAMGHQVIDRGTHGHDSVDYPDFAAAVGQDIQGDRADFGVLICTTGIGISISANKMVGIRAALVHNEDGARFCRQHNDANVICFGAKYHTAYLATQLTKIFLSTDFEKGRHVNRIAKIDKLLCNHSQKPNHNH